MIYEKKVMIYSEKNFYDFFRNPIYMIAVRDIRSSKQTVKHTGRLATDLSRNLIEI